MFCEKKNAIRIFKDWRNVLRAELLPSAPFLLKFIVVLAVCQCVFDFEGIWFLYLKKVTLPRVIQPRPSGSNQFEFRTVTFLSGVRKEIFYRGGWFVKGAYIRSKKYCIFKREKNLPANMNLRANSAPPPPGRFGLRVGVKGAWSAI